MRWAFVILLAVHGLIHFIGFAKAFGLGEFPQLTQPISRPWGRAWLVAGLLVLLTAGLFAFTLRGWWVVGIGAVLLSQAVIVSSWTDAKYGTIANVLILATMVYGLTSGGPSTPR